MVDRERRALEESVAANRSTQTTVSKAARNLAKSAQRVQADIHAKEMERANMENEAARIRLDALNTEAHNSQLQDGLSGLVQQLRDKDQLIEKYELEIRQRNDEIEKKMYLVDRLNRKCVRGQAANRTLRLISPPPPGPRPPPPVQHSHWHCHRAALPAPGCPRHQRAGTSN